MACNRAPGTGSPDTGQTFTNWSRQVSLTPDRIYHPTTIDELVAIVREAEANGKRVHAAGSAWSFTDVMVTPDYQVCTDRLTDTLSETMSRTPYPNDPVFNALTGVARQRLLCHVEAGAKIHDLHDDLEANYRHPGVVLNDGPGGTPQRHGYALTTLGGSGGQSIVGAVSTSTHGGDNHDQAGNFIRPLPDMVQGIHLVGAGGAEYFIQRGGVRAIVDVARLAELMPCVAGRIISDDEVFNSVVVSMGRMGVIYSVVLEVRQQYVLLEQRVQDTWGSLRVKARLGELRASHRFVQVVILPYVNSHGDRTCFVTTRDEVEPMGPPTGPSGFDAFTFACAHPEGLAAAVAVVIQGLAGAVAALLQIPVVGPVLAAADIALIGALSPLLDPQVTIAECLASAVNIASNLGRGDLGEWVVNTILSGAQSPQRRQDLSYKIMDTYNYGIECYKALSIEVAFDAQADVYIEYLDRVFELIDTFASQDVLLGAYISLRYCAGSEALLAIEQWPDTVTIEISALAGLEGELDVLKTLEQEAAIRGAAIHWGQLNNRSRADIQAVFPGNIDRWRRSLARLTATGSGSTFDNAFCERHGLETYDITVPKREDLSYLVPLLLDDP